MHVAGRARRHAGGAVALLLLLLSLTGWLSDSPSAAASTDPPQVLVVLDVSHSMGKSAGNGLTRLQAARVALAELVHGLPQDSPVGLRVYGADYAGKVRKESCADSRMLLPLAPHDPQDVLDAVAGLEPTGQTPIGQALKYAAADLAARPGGGSRHIVLISDGQDTCGAPGSSPCAVADAIKRTGMSVRIETVGVELAGKGADALRCIARHSGGDYYPAGDAEALTAALERISSDALGQLGAGKPIRGGPSAASAVKVTPGSYRLSLRPGQEAWFSFDGAEGADPRVLTTVEGLPSLSVPAEFRGCRAWEVQLYNPYGEGGSFPPYGTSAAFIGVGMGAAGASTTGALDPYSKGIDFPGTWTVRLALARDEDGDPSDCAKPLPADHAFPARFSLQLSTDAAEGDDAANATGDPSPSAPETPGGATDTATPTTAPANPGADDPELAQKYDAPVDPDAPPGWLPAVSAVTFALAAVGLGSLIYRIIRRRRRGW